MLLELLIVFLLHGNSEADIIPLDRTYIVKKVNEDVFIPWTYDYENDMFNVGWSFKNSSSTTVILTKVLQNPAQVHNNFNVQHDGNGNITLKKVTTENEGIYYCKVVYTGASARITVTGTATLSIDTGTTTSSTSTAIPLTSSTPTTTTHLVAPNITNSTTSTTTTTATPSISTSTTITTSIKASTRTTNSAVPTQTETQPLQDNSIILVIVVPSVVGGLFVIVVAVTVALVRKFRKNKTLHNNRSKHHKEGHSKKENKGRHLKRQPEYSEYIPSHRGFSANELYGYKMYSGQIEIKRNPLYSHHLDRHMNMSYVTNRGQHHNDQLYNGNQFLGYQMPSARADPLYTRRGHMIQPEHRYQYSTNPRATTLRTQDNTIVTDYSWNWNGN